MAYTDKEKEEIQSEINSTANNSMPMSQSLGFVIYDVMRVQLEELIKIRKLLESHVNQ